MKVRNDYVSNSSSASFVIREGVERAFTVFCEDFRSFLEENGLESLGETFNIAIMLKDSSDWDYYTGSIFDFLEEVESEKLNVKLSDLEYIRFDCDDWDSNGLMSLGMLYAYFNKLGFKPDASDSERDFPQDVLDKSFVVKIIDRFSKMNSNNESTTEG